MTLPQPAVRSAPRAERHDLPSVRVQGTDVGVRLELELLADGSWSGRLRFLPPASLVMPVTGAIFRGRAAADLLAAARGLREHHVRDLYRSLGGAA